MAVRSRFDADDFGNDKMPERYGGVGRFADAVVQTDGVATSIDDLQAWDSDEDMEQLEFDLLDTAEDMQVCEADVVFEKSQLPLSGEGCWEEMAKRVEKALETEAGSDAITLSGLRFQEDKEVAGRGKRAYITNSEEWMALHKEWSQTLHSRRRQNSRRFIKERLKVRMGPDQTPTNRTNATRGVWEMALRPVNHANFDISMFFRLTQLLNEPSRETQLAAVGGLFALHRPLLEGHGTVWRAMKKRLPCIVQSLVNAAVPPRKVPYNAGELRRIFDQQLRIQFGPGLTSRQKAQVAFTQFDADNSGAIDVHELRELLAALGMVLDEHGLAQAMKTLDEDGSGDVDRQEFEHWFEKTAEEHERFQAEMEAAAEAEQAKADAAAAAKAARATARGNLASRGNDKEAREDEMKVDAGEDVDEDASEKDSEAVVVPDGTSEAEGKDGELAVDTAAEDSPVMPSPSPSPSPLPIAPTPKPKPLNRRGSFAMVKDAREQQREETLRRLAAREAGRDETEEDIAARCTDEAIIEYVAGMLSCMARDQKARRALGSRANLRALLEMASRTLFSIANPTIGGGVGTELGGAGGAFHAAGTLCRILGAGEQLRRERRALRNSRRDSVEALAQAEADAAAYLQDVNASEAAQAVQKTEDGAGIEDTSGAPIAKPDFATLVNCDPADGNENDAEEIMKKKITVHDMSPTAIDGEFRVGVERFAEVGGVLKATHLILETSALCDAAAGPLTETSDADTEDGSRFPVAVEFVARLVSVLGLAAKDDVACSALYESEVWHCMVSLLHACAGEIAAQRRRASGKDKEVDEDKAKGKKNKKKVDATPQRALFAALLAGTDPKSLQKLLLSVLLVLRGAANAAMRHFEVLSYDSEEKLAHARAGHSSHMHMLPGFCRIDSDVDDAHGNQKDHDCECVLHDTDIELLLRLAVGRNQTASLSVLAIFAALSHTTSSTAHQLASYEVASGKKSRNPHHPVVLLMCRAARGSCSTSIVVDKSNDAELHELQLKTYGVAGLAGLASDAEARRFLVHVAVPLPMPGTHCSAGENSPLLEQLMDCATADDDEQIADRSMHKRHKLAVQRQQLRRHAASALMLLSLACGDSSADAEELVEAHAEKLVEFTDARTRWRWPVRHLQSVISLLKHQDLALLSPTALSIFALSREVTGSNAQIFIASGAIPLLVGWAATLLFTAEGEPGRASASEGETAPESNTAGATSTSVPLAPARWQLTALKPYERAALLEYVVAALWMLLHGGINSGYGVGIDADAEAEWEMDAQNTTARRVAAAQLARCGGGGVLVDVARVCGALALDAPDNDSHLNAGSTTRATLLRVQQHALAAAWASCKSGSWHARGAFARAGLLPLLLRVSCTDERDHFDATTESSELKDGNTGGTTLNEMSLAARTHAATRYLSAQLLQILLKIAVGDGTDGDEADGEEQVAALTPSGWDSEGEDDREEGYDSEDDRESLACAAIELMAASSQNAARGLIPKKSTRGRVQRADDDERGTDLGMDDEDEEARKPQQPQTGLGQGGVSIEAAMLLLLDTPCLPAAQAYGAAVLARLAVALPQKRIISAMGGVAVAERHLRNCWTTVSANPNSRGLDDTGKDAWFLQYEALERILHFMLNLSTDFQNQQLMTELGVDVVLDIARSADRVFAGKRPQRASQGRPRSQAPLQNCHFDGEDPKAAAMIERNNIRQGITTDAREGAPPGQTGPLFGAGYNSDAQQRRRARTAAAVESTFTPLQLACWLLDNLSRNPASRNVFFQNELRLKTDDAWLHEMSLADSIRERDLSQPGQPVPATGADEFRKQLAAAAEAAHAEAPGPAEIAAVEAALISAEYEVQDLLRRQREALSARLRAGGFAKPDDGDESDGSSHGSGIDFDVAVHGVAPELRAAILGARQRCVALTRMLQAMEAAITDSGAPSITLKQADARAAAAAAAAALTFGGALPGPPKITDATASAIQSACASPVAGDSGEESDDGTDAGATMKSASAKLVAEAPVQLTWPSSDTMKCLLQNASKRAKQDTLGQTKTKDDEDNAAQPEHALDSPRQAFDQWWNGDMKEQDEQSRRFAAPPRRTREQLAMATLRDPKRRDKHAHAFGPSASELATRKRFGGEHGAMAAAADASTSGALPMLNTLKSSLGTRLRNVWGVKLAPVHPNSQTTVGFKDRWCPTRTDLFLAQYHAEAERPLGLSEDQKSVSIRHWRHVRDAGTCTFDLLMPSFDAAPTQQTPAARVLHSRSARAKQLRKTSNDDGKAVPHKKPVRSRRRRHRLALEEAELKASGKLQEANADMTANAEKAVADLERAEAERRRKEFEANDPLALHRRRKAREEAERKRGHVHLYVHDRLHERIEDFSVERAPACPFAAPTPRRPFGGLFFRRPCVPLPAAPHVSALPRHELVPAPPPPLPPAKTLPGPTWGILPDTSMYFVVVTLEGAMPPLISPASADMPLGMLVDMQCDTDGADIFYTTDGTDPVPDESAKYTEPFKLDRLGSWHIRALSAGGGRKKPSVIAEVRYEVMKPEDVKGPWTVQQSVFAPRFETSASKDVFDTARLMREQFELDWERCMKKETFTRYMAQNIREYVDVAIAEEKLEKVIESVKEEIWEDYDVICSAFDFYAACSTGDGFAMKLNSYTDFLDDCFIPEDHERCDARVLDEIFTVVNIEDSANVSAIENRFNADRAFVRCEFVEMIVRVGFAKYLHTQETEDPNEAIDFICERNILAQLEPAAANDRNEFRRERLYIEEVDQVYRDYEYDTLLRCCFEQCTKKKPGTDEKMMNIKEFVGFLEVVGLLGRSDEFTVREARLCFVWGKMRVKDELLNRFAHTHACFTDFLEALAYVADLISLPEIVNGENPESAQKPKTTLDRKAEEEAALLADIQPALPLAKKLEELFLAIFSVYDSEGDGNVTPSAITRFHIKNPAKT
eukprot:g900.t1